MRVREYVDAHLGSRLDVDALARIVGLSVSHFSRSFQKAVGMSPHRYVIQCRVIRGQELLATTQLPLTEIALTIGFANQSHFSRRFHEVIGVPPRQFRRLVAGAPVTDNTWRLPAQPGRVSPARPCMLCLPGAATLSLDARGGPPG
jgi:transcriptional regulator GlxA family with amidase domain